VWLAALLAASGALSEDELPYADSALFLLACALTQLLYPTYHDALFQRVPSAWLLALLTLRDALLFLIGARLAMRIWRYAAPENKNANKNGKGHDARAA
jgi:hypothetical protein